MEFMKKHVHCLIIFCFARSIAAVGGVHKQPNHAAPALFVFGDSLADAGNNNFIPNRHNRADFPPYGMSFFGHPTGRFTNGHTVFDFIATYMGLPFPSPSLDPKANFSAGINFASGGSGLLDSTGQSLNIMPLSGQIRQFTHFASTLVNRKSYLSKSLYCISIGANDIDSYIKNVTYHTTTSSRGLVKLLLKKYEHYLTTLYRSGARKFFLSDIGTVGCTPYARLYGYSIAKGKCVEKANELVQEYNAGLNKLLKHAMRKLQGSVIVRPNSYNFTISVIENYRAYEFGETKSACCGAGMFNAKVKCGKWKENGVADKPFVCKDPNAYLFWDWIHPTERLNAIFAHQIWTGNSSVMSPFNLSTLVLGNAIHAPPSPERQVLTL